MSYVVFTILILFSYVNCEIYTKCASETGKYAQFSRCFLPSDKADLFFLYKNLHFSFKKLLKNGMS